MSGRLARLAERLQDIAQVAVEQGGVRAPVQRLADPSDCRLALAALMVQQAKQMQRVGVPRLVRQRPAVKRLRLAEPARLMQTHGVLERGIGSPRVPLRGHRYLTSISRVTSMMRVASPPPPRSTLYSPR